MAESKNPGVILQALLRSREERAFAQKFLLDIIGGEGCIAQISLNIPGWPKKIAGCERALLYGDELFRRELAPLSGARVFARVPLSNDAGGAIIYALRIRGRDEQNKSAAERLKMKAIKIEESERGRVLDIDIITRLGQISRDALGREPRKCLLCAECAKVCAREGRHGAEELREAVGLLLRHNQVPANKY
jgi:holo-ACP synthase CitX